MLWLEPQEAETRQSGERRQQGNRSDAAHRQLLAQATGAHRSCHFTPRTKAFQGA